MQLAEAGNVTMLIWLGKQILGQRDLTSLEHSASGGETLEVIVTKVGGKPRADPECLKKKPTQTPLVQ